MANKPVIYKFEDSQTGKTYQIEGDPDTSEDEASSFLGTLTPDQLTQYELKQPTAQPTAPVSQPVPASAVSSEKATPVASPAPTPVEDQKFLVQGLGNKDQFHFKPEVQSELDAAAANPNIAPKDFNALVQKRQIEAGQPALGLVPGYEVQLNAYRQSLGHGNSPQSLGYTDVKLPTLSNPTVSLLQSGAPGTLGGGIQGQILNWLTRSFQEAANNPDTFAGLTSREYGQLVYGDQAKAILLKQYPQLTDDQASTLANTWISQIQQRAAQANEQEVANDPLAARLVGGIAGSAGPEYALAPELGAGVMARAGGTAAVTAGANAAYQGAAVEQGAQDHFDPAAVAEAGAMGGAFHLGMEGLNHAVGSLRPTISPDAGEPVPVSGISVPTATKKARTTYGAQIDESRQQMYNHVQETTSGWQNAPEFQVHRNFSKLNGVDNSALAVTLPTGEVAFNAEAILKVADRKNVTPEEVFNAATYHEALGHHGLAQKFGSDLQDTLLDFYHNGVDSFRDKVDNWLEQNPEGYKDNPNRLALATEEVLADMSNHGPIPAKLVDRITNTVKDYARRMGINLKYSEREIRTIVGLAHDATIKGSPMVDTGATEPRYMNVGRGAELPIDQLSGRIKAEIRDSKGADPEDIYRDTGWWKDRDGKWRTRLSDAQSGLIIDPKTDKPVLDGLNDYKDSTVGRILDHPELYKAYPWLKDVEVQQTSDPNKLGVYNPDNNKISINARALKAAGEDPRAVLLHEIQHAIQKKEGFATGGNSDSALALTIKNHEIIPAAKKLIEEHKANLERINDTYEEFGKALKHPSVKPGTPLHEEFVDRMNELRTTAALHEADISSLKEDIHNGDTADLYDRLLDSRKVKAEAYHWLMGEAEARDAENYKNLPQKELLDVGPGVGRSENLHPDYLRVTRGQVSAAAEQSPKYMHDYKTKQEAADESAMLSARKTLSEALDHFEPTIHTWAEARREARDRSLTTNQIRKAKKLGVENFDKKIFQMDYAARKRDEQIARLNEKRDNGTFTAQDMATYKEAVFSYNEALSRIWEQHSEIARSLNALKAVEYSRRKFGELKEYLDSELSKNDPLANPAHFEEFADRVKYLMEAGKFQAADQMFRQVMKPYWWQYLLSFRHSMMLSGIGTSEKNTIDNAVQLWRNLQENTVAFNFGEVAGQTYGIFRAALDSLTYKNAWQALKKGHLNHEISAKTEMQDAHIPILGKVADFLYAQDVFFRAFHQNAHLYSIGYRKAREQGLKGLEAFQEGSNLAHNPTLEMLNESKMKSDEALLVDSPSGLSAWVEPAKVVRPGMSGGEQARSALANFVFPFLRVSDRVLWWKIRRSPLSFLDKNTRADFAAGGARRRLAIARTLYGSALISYYWMKSGAKDGNVSGDKTGDYDKDRALQAGGYQPNSVVKDGKYVDATALQQNLVPTDMQNSLASNVGGLRQAWDKGQNVEEGLKFASKSLLQSLASNSFANNLEPFIAPFESTQNNDFDASLANLGGSLATQWEPAAARQYNQAINDPIQRDTSGDKSIMGRIEGRAMAGIPGLSDKLPPKYDVYGEQIPQGRSISGVDNYQTIKTDTVSKELQRLERTTDKPVVLGAPSSFGLTGVKAGVFNSELVRSTDDNTVKLTAPAQEEWQRVQGYYLKTAMKTLISSPGWKKVPDEQKVKIVKQIKSEAYDATKAYMLPHLGLQADEDATTTDEEDNQ